MDRSGDNLTKPGERQRHADPSRHIPNSAFPSGPDGHLLQQSGVGSVAFRPASDSQETVKDVAA